MYSIEMALLYAEARQREFTQQADEHRWRKLLASEQRAPSIWRRYQRQLPALFQSDRGRKPQAPACITG